VIVLLDCGHRFGAATDADQLVIAAEDHHDRRQHEGLVVDDQDAPSSRARGYRHRRTLDARRAGRSATVR
jgi:hypothetical protein